MPSWLKSSALTKGTAHEVLGINEDVEPMMTLTFMSLAVIPEIRLTDMGLFDVNQFAFIPVEAD